MKSQNFFKVGRELSPVFLQLRQPHDQQATTNVANVYFFEHLRVGQSLPDLSAQWNPPGKLLKLPVFHPQQL